MFPRKHKILACLALALACPLPTLASDHATLKRLRATTSAMLEALVESGMISREKAVQILEQAEQQGRQAEATARLPGSRPAAGSGAEPVRVPYVPEPVRQQIREEIKQEVLAQARQERWGGEQAALPDWLDRFRFEAEVRVRYQDDSFADGNAAAAAYYQDGDLATNHVDLGNTLEDQHRLRLRARFGVQAKIDERVEAGLRLSTGSLTGPVSTSSTAGDPGNRYGVKLDRGYIRLMPVDGVVVNAGRMSNPFWSTEIQHAADLGFDGVSGSWRPDWSDTWKPFATAGVFPMRHNTHGPGRRLMGMQLGTAWQPNKDLTLRAAFARYDFKHAHASARYDMVDLAYLSGEYEKGYRQRGNTLFQINQDPYDPDYLKPVYGLASRFDVKALTLGAEIGYFDPFRIGLVAELIRNDGFDAADIAARSGGLLPGLARRNQGQLYRIVFGAMQVTERGQWQASITYRKLERDATVDALTDADFLLGGTNSKGYVLGFTYGIAANTTLGLRYLSAETIDPPVFDPSLPPLRINTLQFDLNTRF